MLQITPSQDCGNSPKNKLIHDLEIACAVQDRLTIAGSLTQDVIYHIAGGQTLQGLEPLLRRLQGDAETAPLSELVIGHVISHGKAGAVNGVRRYADGKVVEFCSVYEFSSTKGTAVSAITHYAVM